MNQIAYIPPEVTEGEAARLEELYGLRLLDTASELRFDRYTSLVAGIFGFPIVLITLLDRDRQWFKSRLGWNQTQCPRDISFCGHAINQDSMLVVPDALEDPRFAGNPLVTGDPHIRFYAGAVVRGPTGQPLGTLCVLDHQPRHFDEAHRAHLRQFADLVENEIAHIADLLALKSSIERFAYYDPLTQLPNRQLLMDRLGQLVRLAAMESMQVEVLLFNVTGLRLINQSLGTRGGDELLQQLAGRLRENCPEGGSAARLQADELVLVFPVHCESQRQEATRRIHGALERPYHCQGREHYLRVQIGGSLFPDQGDSAEALIEQASAAIRVSPESLAEPVHYFDLAHSDAFAEILKIESCLKGALAGDELYMLYQPIFSLSTGRMTGVEALLRWRCPELGQVSPDRFIPLAEQSGLIVPIGRWVREEVCRQLQVWCSDPDWDITVAMNVSPVELAQPTFAEELLDQLTSSQVPEQLLRVEITEHSLVRDNEAVEQNLVQLKARDIEINIDDFGTGYSSLSYLRRLPVSSLKIDRSFVDGLPAREDGATITRTIIEMARALGLDQVAEGVEKPEQLAFLHGHQCTYGQGFLFSRPLPPEQIPGLRGRGVVL
ncbi:diguanylate cyclase (GGDEF) domain-containing protein [Marinobacter daqiaonensis]|uniref:Diguanylate cyclase (GGDEF) domain-containing protein n=1 Tax=Marinobacter daqiaonensis TaxID=650891 RepID=A0A1I6HIB0_9GAMM|nr:GGDEF domain-containing protein [Marinobacter daqiaonensis]SFR54223.1 diguanylate cyclase (GGDEF) domain-containing protein [Marinobacter daqiaonensis]